METNECENQIKFDSCNTYCPHCGETRGMLEYLEMGIKHKGLITETVNLKRGIFKRRTEKYIFYNCETCGIEWSMKIK